MWKTLKFIIIVLGILFSFDVSANEQVIDSSISQKWRFGYLEGGNYTSYKISLLTTVKALNESGYLKIKTQLPSEKDFKDSKEIWHWLAKNSQSDYIEFVLNAFWSMDWDKDQRESIRAQVLDRLDQGDIDLMIGAGTWAGLALANNEHSTPTVIISVSNAVKAGISQSYEYSGLEHLHVQTNPWRYKRQAILFHHVIGFKKVGIIYQNDIEGRTYAGISEFEEVSEEKEFQIIHCHILPDPDSQIELGRLLNCLDDIVTKIDAFYLTEHSSTTLNTLPQILKSLLKYRIPVFAQHGERFVEHGALFSIAQAGYKYIGRFYAQTIVKILQGTKPGHLSQIFEDPQKIAINLDTAKKINFILPEEFLNDVDKIYHTTATIKK